MTSDSDDLEKALRENLKLRSELVGEVSKAKAASQRGVAYRLGWVLYWACLALAGSWVVGHVWLALHGGLLFDELTKDPLTSLIVFGVPVLALYGLGRAFRYLLSGE